MNLDVNKLSDLLGQRVTPDDLGDALDALDADEDYFDADEDARAADAAVIRSAAEDLYALRPEAHRDDRFLAQSRRLRAIADLIDPGGVCMSATPILDDAEAIRNYKAASLRRTISDAERLTEIEALFRVANRLETDLDVDMSDPDVKRLRRVATRLSEATA